MALRLRSGGARSLQGVMDASRWLCRRRSRTSTWMWPPFRGTASSRRRSLRRRVTSRLESPTSGFLRAATNTGRRSTTTKGVTYTKCRLQPLQIIKRGTKAGGLAPTTSKAKSRRSAAPAQSTKTRSSSKSTSKRRFRTHRAIPVSTCPRSAPKSRQDTPRPNDRPGRSL